MTTSSFIERSKLPLPLDRVNFSDWVTSLRAKMPSAESAFTATRMPATTRMRVPLSSAVFWRFSTGVLSTSPSRPLPALERPEAHEEAEDGDRGEVHERPRVDEAAREGLIARREGDELDGVAQRTPAERRGQETDRVEEHEDGRRHEEGDDVALGEAGEHHPHADRGSAEEEAPQVPGQHRTPVERPEPPGPPEHREGIEERKREEHEDHRERGEVLAEDHLAVADGHRDEELERARALLGGERSHRDRGDDEKAHERRQAREHRVHRGA